MYDYRNVYFGDLCTQIKATLVASVFDILLGVAQLTIASFGVAEDMNCYGYYPYYNCNSWVGPNINSLNS